jgi:hypothetical protein
MPKTTSLCALSGDHVEAWATAIIGIAIAKTPSVIAKRFISYFLSRLGRTLCSRAIGVIAVDTISTAAGVRAQTGHCRQGSELSHRSLFNVTRDPHYSLQQLFDDLLGNLLKRSNARLRTGNRWLVLT